MSAADWLNVLTVVLAGATVWLGISTWRMATIAKASFDLESRPYFAFKTFLFKFFVNKGEEEGALKVGLMFSNPGRVLIHYTIKRIRVTFSGVTVENPKFENLGGVIYPSDTTVFWFPPMPKVEISGLPKSGTVEYEAEYRRGTNGTGPFTSSRTIQYTINSVRPDGKGDFDWLYLDQKDT